MAQRIGPFPASQGPPLIDPLAKDKACLNFNQKSLSKEPIYDIFESGKSVRTAHMTRHLLSKGRSIQAISEVWQELPIWLKDFRYEDLMEWLIERGRIITAARILSATCASLDPRTVGTAFSELVYGNLAVLSVPIDVYWARFRERQALRLQKLLYLLLEKKNIKFEPFQKSQFVFYHLVRNLPASELSKFYEHVALHGDGFRYYTILHFIDRLAKEEDYYKAYLLLQALQREGRLRDSEISRKAITLLLVKATNCGQQAHAEDILRTMFEAGVQTHTPIYNVLIYNAIRNNQPQSALAIYRKMLEDGFQPNPVTFACLFTMYKRSGDVLEQRKVIQQALEADQTISGYLATDIVHAAYKTAEPNIRYRDTIHAYQRVFEPGVLGVLGLVSRKVNDDIGLRIKCKPGPFVIAIVINAFLRDPNNFEASWELYTRYVTVRDSQEYNHVFDHSPMIPNAFLLVFADHASTLNKMLEVMDDLLQKSRLKWKKKPVPNEYSWSILAKAFARQGRMAEAEKIVKVMVRRGFKPTEATWAAILEGHIKEGNYKEGGKTLGKMLASGIQPTDRTLHVVAGMHKQDDFQIGLSITKQTVQLINTDAETYTPMTDQEAKARLEQEEKEEMERILFAEALERIEKLRIERMAKRGFLQDDAALMDLESTMAEKQLQSKDIPNDTPSPVYIY